ncbi:putative Arrestin-like protein [Pseudoloma neurophilia]|uniref:Putative Arrestin-like protein n=1 Tax=Pseudoloma neurophilia TaxID=146866 RepID=A0A0R0LVH3_9MICR|nr:putative Arrestin-like protein [Pseudoloma neurophilia]
MAKFNFDVIIDKSYYEKGENITGTVHLELLRPLKVKNIFLEFFKTFECEFQEYSTFKDGNNKINNFLYNQKVTLYEGKKILNELGSGHHRFPFSIKPKYLDSGSSKFSDFFQETFLKFKSSYNVTATLNIHDEQSIIKKSTKEVIMCPRIDIVRKMTEKITIMSCICFRSTDILLIAYADKEKYRASEVIQFVSRLSSDNSKIKRMKTRLVCNIWINFRNIRQKQSKILVEVDNTKTENGDCVAMLKIPTNAPSSTEEKHLRVFYTLEALVYVNSSSPIKISRKIALEPERYQNERYVSIGAIKGVQFPSKHLDIE